MALADNLVTVDGLPLHPLVMHAVVVLLPLSAVGAVAIAVRPPWRRRFGPVVALLTVLAVAAVPIAQQTGAQLEDKLTSLENPLIEQHAQLGETLLPYAVVFGALVLVLVLLGRLADRRARAGAPAATPRRGPWTVLLVAVAVLTVLSAVTTTAWVIQIGHSGSTAVWEGVANLR